MNDNEGTTSEQIIHLESIAENVRADMRDASVLLMAKPERMTSSLSKKEMLSSRRDGLLCKSSRHISTRHSCP